MAVSPLQSSNGVVNISVYSAGKDITTTLQIKSVDVSKGLNRIPSAKIVVVDGDMAEGKFPISDQEVFKPGTEIEIKAGYESTTESVFKGIVVRHGLSIHAGAGSELHIECKDKAVAMTVGRKNANYLDMDDAAILKKVIGCYGLAASAESSAGIHNELLQYYCTDWDFVLTRAEANSCWVRVDDGVVNVEKAEAKGSASLVLTYGNDIYEFSADADAQNQVSNVQAVSWDPSTQAIVSAEASTETLAASGNLDAATMAKVLGVSKEMLVSSAALQKDELAAWSKSQQVKNSLNRLRGRVSFPGSALAKVGSILELKGVGERFSGNVLITSVLHKIENGTWLTEVGFGMSAQWFAEQYNTAAPMASGLNSGVAGLHVGIVTKLDGDPDNKCRIQVKLPVWKNETEGVWARLGSPYASEQCGILFLPEINDEVIVGFFNDDPSHPVILGSLYSAKRKPSVEFAAENKIKSIITKSKLTIEFEEEKKKITLKSPSDNSVVIDDESKSITLKDQTGNTVVLNEKGILLKSPKDIQLMATGKIILDATGNLNASSKGDLALEGMNVKINAKVGLTAKGSANAELSASGQTVVKGAMVMIN